MSGDAPAGGGFDAASANIRETVKWLITAFAGSTAILIGTSPLTNLGALDTLHLTIALVSAVVGIGAAFAAIDVVLRILVAKPLFVSDIARHAELKAFVDGIAPDVLPPTIRSWDQFVQERRELLDRMAGGDNDADTQRSYTAVVNVTTRVLSIVYFERLRSDFEKTRVRLFVLAATVTVAFGCFSWASNSAPEHEKKPGTCLFCNVGVST